MLTLVGELKGMEMQVCELQQRLNEKDMQIDTLLREAQVMQTQCHEKIKVLVTCTVSVLNSPPSPSPPPPSPRPQRANTRP